MSGAGTHQFRFDGDIRKLSHPSSKCTLEEASLTVLGSSRVVDIALEVGGAASGPRVDRGQPDAPLRGGLECIADRVDRTRRVADADHHPCHRGAGRHAVKRMDDGDGAGGARNDLNADRRADQAPQTAEPAIAEDEQVGAQGMLKHRRGGGPDRKPRRYLAVRCHRPRASDGFLQHLLGSGPASVVAGSREDSKPIQRARPGEGVHDTKWATADRRFGRRPVQRIECGA